MGLFLTWGHVARFRGRGVSWAGSERPEGYVELQRKDQECWKQVCQNITSCCVFMLSSLLSSCGTGVFPATPWPTSSSLQSLHPPCPHCRHHLQTVWGWNQSDPRWFWTVRPQLLRPHAGVCLCVCVCLIVTGPYLSCVDNVVTVFFVPRYRSIGITTLWREMPSARSTWTKAPPSWSSSLRRWGGPTRTGPKSSSWRVRTHRHESCSELYIPLIDHLWSHDPAAPAGSKLFKLLEYYRN